MRETEYKKSKEHDNLQQCHIKNNHSNEIKHKGKCGGGHIGGE